MVKPQDNLNPESENLDPETTTESTTEKTTISDWREGWDEGIKANPSIQKFKTPQDLGKSYLELEKLVGREKIPMPRKDSEGNYIKEDLDIVYERLGRPKNPDEYKLPEVSMPEGYPPFEENQVKEFKTKAHELGLNQRQTNEIFKWYSEMMGNDYNQYLNHTAESKQQAESALRKEWGKAYGQNLDVAKKVINKFGGSGLLAKLEETGLGNDPDIVKFFHRIGKGVSEDVLQDVRGVGSFTMTPQEAKMEIDKIMADKKGAYWDKDHLEHKTMVQKVQHLHQMAEREKSE